MHSDGFFVQDDTEYEPRDYGSCSDERTGDSPSKSQRDVILVL